MAPYRVFVVLSSLFIIIQGGPDCQMFGMTYSPYRVIDTCPTAKEAAEDVEILLRHTRHVRTYTTLCREANRVLMRHATEGGLSVLFGVWIDGVDMDQMEIDHLMEVLREYPHADIAGIAIGNEVAFRGSLSEEEVVQLVTDMRQQIRALGQELSSDMLLNVPVFTIEIIPKPALVEVSDIVAINIHPFFRLDLPHVEDPEEMSDEIIEAAAQQIDIYRNMAPEKELIITEIGWPSDSSEQTDPNFGSMELSHLFMKKFTAFAAASNLQYYFFEIFDAEWKKGWYTEPDDSLSEFHWGLYSADRKVPKYPECL